jgi:PPM family protein phosphatase
LVQTSSEKRKSMKLVEGRHRQGKGTLSHYVYSEVNQRENNEDSFHMYGLYLPASQQTFTVLSIADGMGGHAWGEHVSRETLHKVSLALFEQFNVDHSLNVLEQELVVDIDQLVQAIESAIKEANAHVLHMISNNNWRKAGSTIAIVVILENTAVVVSLGDSPVFHYESRVGRLSKMTIDHTVANLRMLEGKITPEMAQHHSGRSVLKWHIGQEKLPARLPARSFELEEGDLLLLCTDGVTGLLSEQQIADILSAPQCSLKDIAHQLIEAALQAGETDNQTLFLWQHSPVPTEQKEENRMEQEKSNVGAEKLADIETRLALAEDVLTATEGRLTTVDEQIRIANEKLEALDEKVEQDEEKIEEVERRLEEEDWAVEYKIPEINGHHVIDTIEDGDSEKQNDAVKKEEEDEEKKQVEETKGAEDGEENAAKEEKNDEVETAKEEEKAEEAMVVTGEERAKEEGTVKEE